MVIHCYARHTTYLSMRLKTHVGLGLSWKKVDPLSITECGSFKLIALPRWASSRQDPSESHFVVVQVVRNSLDKKRRYSTWMSWTSLEGTKRYDVKTAALLVRILVRVNGQRHWTAIMLEAWSRCSILHLKPGSIGGFTRSPWVIYCGKLPWKYLHLPQATGNLVTIDYVAIISIDYEIYNVAQYKRITELWSPSTD